MLSARGAFEMEGEYGRMATMESFPFYNISEISAKTHVSMFLGLSYMAISRGG